MCHQCLRFYMELDDLNKRFIFKILIACDINYYRTKQDNNRHTAQYVHISTTDSHNVVSGFLITSPTIEACAYCTNIGLWIITRGGEQTKEQCRQTRVIVCCVCVQMVANSVVIFRSITTNAINLLRLIISVAPGQVLLRRKFFIHWLIFVRNPNWYFVRFQMRNRC